MIVRLISRTLVWLAATAVLLFLPAGTVRWPGAWVMLAELGALAMIVGIWLLRRDAQLLRERLSSVVQREQRTWGKLLMCTVVLVWGGWFVLMGLTSGSMERHRCQIGYRSSARSASRCAERWLS